MNKRLTKLEEQITLIKDNHLVHLADNMNEMKIEITEVRTNVNWLIQNHIVVRNAVYASLISGLIGTAIAVLK
jgi:hypothetical protein